MIIDMCNKRDSLSFDEFVRPIIKITKEEVIHYKDLTGDMIKKSERIILSGTAIKDNSCLDDLDSFSWLKDFDKPVFGICIGAEVLAVLFGAGLRKVQEIGMTSIKVIKQNSLIAAGIEVFEVHNNAIKKSEDIEVLAVSDVCIQAFKVKGKPFYGVQFHPEVRHEEIIENFLNLG